MKISNRNVTILKKKEISNTGDPGTSLVLKNFPEHPTFISKTYPFYQLPLLAISHTIKKIINKICSVALERNFSMEETKKRLLRANEQRQVFNALKTQKLITRIENALIRSIHENQSILLMKVGYDSSESHILALEAKKYFLGLGMSDIQILTTGGNLYFQVTISYG